MVASKDQIETARGRAGALGLALLLAALPAAAGTLRVCADGCRYPTLQAAHDAARPGDTVELAGTVAGALRVLKPLTFAGAPGAVLDCRGARPAEGKSCLLPLADGPVAVRDLTIRGGTTATDGIGACVRGGDAFPADITIERLDCADGHNGIMGPFARLTVAASTIRPAGGAAGYLVHALYAYARGDIGDCRVVSRDTDWIASAAGGSAISQKCRSSDFAGGTIAAVESAAIDIRRGDGRHRFAGVAIAKRAGAPNRELVSFGRTDGCGAGGGVLELVGIAWPERPPDSPWYWPFPVRWRIVSNPDCGAEIVADTAPPRHVAVPANFRVDPGLQ